MNERIVESNAMPLPVGFCYKCKHKYADSLGCKAFPNGIPDKLALGEIDHNVVFPEQEGTFIYLKQE